MTKLNEIFPDTNSITISEIEGLINSGILHENHEIELTDIDNYITGKSQNQKKKEKKKQKIKIVSEIISFLNSGRGIGVLFLGLAEINGEIVPKGVKSFKNKEQIRSIVYNNIGSIPSNIKNFKLDIITIEHKDANIFIIDVENNDLDCIFYSKIDNLSYERRGEECKSISLPDFLEVLAQKNHARLYAHFEETEINDDFYTFQVTLSNNGLEPGMYVTTKITTVSIEKIEFSSKYIIKSREHILEIKNDKLVRNSKIIGEIEQLDTLIWNSQGDNSIKIEGKQIFNWIFFGTAGSPPKSDLVYPGMNHIFGSLTIEKKDFEILFCIETYEKKGKTNQEFLIKSKNGKIEILEIFRSFKPYLRI